MISGGIEVNINIDITIRLILEVKFGDDPLKLALHLTLWHSLMAVSSGIQWYSAHVDR